MDSIELNKLNDAVKIFKECPDYTYFDMGDEYIAVRQENIVTLMKCNNKIECGLIYPEYKNLCYGIEPAIIFDFIKINKDNTELLANIIERILNSHISINTKNEIVEILKSKEII